MLALGTIDRFFGLGTSLALSYLPLLPMTK